MSDRLYQPHTKLLTQLENLVDTYSIAAVLAKLAEIASEKADNVRTNWQDGRLAHDWELIAARLLNDEMFVREQTIVQ